MLGQRSGGDNTVLVVAPAWAGHVIYTLGNCTLLNSSALYCTLVLITALYRTLEQCEALHSCRFNCFTLHRKVLHYTALQASVQFLVQCIDIGTVRVTVTVTVTQ